MTTPQDNIYRLYQNGLKHFSLPDFDTFQQDMKDEQKRRRFYTNMQEAYSLPDFDTFSQDIGAVAVAAPAPAQAPAKSQQTPSTVAPVTDNTAEQAAVKSTVQTSSQPAQPEGWKPSPMQQQAFQRQMDEPNARLKKQGEEFQQRMEGIKKGNKPGAFMGEREFDPQTGQMEKTFYTTQGGRMPTQMQQSRANTEYHQWWENNTEAGQRSKEQRLQREFDARVSSLWSRHNPVEGENAAEKAWSDAEARQKKASNSSADRIYSSRGDAMTDAALLGGPQNRIVNAAQHSYDKAVSHMTNFDLDRLMNESWNNLGEEGQKALIDDCHKILRNRYPGKDDLVLYEQAKSLARHESDMRLYEMAKEKKRPKNELDYLARKIADMNLLTNVSKGLAVSQAKSTGDMATYEAANEEYRQDGHKVLDVAGMVAGFALDPTTLLSAGVGSAATKAAMWAGGRWLAGRGASAAVANAASRQFASSMTGRLVSGVVGGSVNFGTFEGIKEMENQFAHGGHIVGQDESGRYVNEGYSASAVGSQTLHGLGMGASVGWLGPVTGNVSDKLVRGISSTLGKVATRAGLYGGATVAEGTIFSVPEWIEGKRDGFDVWTDNMAMMVGFKAKHMLKSAGGVLGDLKASFDSPTNGSKNRLDFESRLRQRMDAPSDGGLALTKEEKAELKRYGYDLRDLVESAERTSNAKEGSLIAQNAPEIVSRLTEMVNDPRVSEAARAKMYYYATGRMLPMSTVMKGELFENGEGGFTVESRGANGVITSRSFNSRKAADLELERVRRQAELNQLEFGERYQPIADFESRMMEASRRVAVKYGWDAVEVYKTCEDVLDSYVRGKDKELSDVQKNIYGKILYELDGIEVSDLATEKRTRINEKYDVDIDEAIRKDRDRRTEAEQGAIDEYITELMPQKSRNGMFDEIGQRFLPADGESRNVKDVDFQEVDENGQTIEPHFDNPPEDSPRQSDGEKPIGRAVMKYQDRPVEVLSGRVVMTDDGTMVDNERSDSSIVIRDLESGKTEMVSPEAILSYEEYEAPATTAEEVTSTPTEAESGTESEETPQPKYAKGTIKIRNSDGSETRGWLTGERNEDGKNEYYVEGDLRHLHYALDNELDNILSEYIPDEPQDAEQPQPTEPKPIDPNRPAQEGVVNSDDYDKGYSNGIETAENLSDAQLTEKINNLRNGAETLTDFGRGWLEAHEYEQQRRAMEAQGVPNNAESVPNPTENAVSEGENEPEAVSNEETALSRIPVDEETQEPRFTAVDPETAWDGLVEATDGEANALPIAQQMIEDANKRLEALNKKPPTPAKPKLSGKGSPLAMRAEQKRVDDANAKAQADYQQALADAQAEAQAWSNILRVYTDRNAELRRQQEEERRRRDAETHDAAVARFEEEQRLKAEKQAEQEERGAYTPHPDIRKKWDESPKFYGPDTFITLADGTEVPGNFVYHEAFASTPSHDPFNGYEQTEGFPVTPEGRSVNPRAYDADKNAQRTTEEIAARYDTRGIRDDKVVQHGVRISGNGGDIALKMAYKMGTADKFKAGLARKAAEEGIPADDFNSLQYPDRSFVPTQEFEYTPEVFDIFNRERGKGLGRDESAVRQGMLVADDTLKKVVSVIGQYDRLEDFYRNDTATSEVLGLLMSAGVLDSKDLGKYQNGTEISGAGEDLIESVLVGKVFDGDPDAVRKLSDFKEVRRAVVSAMSEISANRALTNREFSIDEELSKAIDLVYRAKKAQPEVFVGGMPVSPFGRMAGLFDDEFGDSRVTDSTVLMLADILNSGRHTELRKVLACYNKDASESASGQMDLWTGSIPTKEEILTNVNDIFKNGTAKEKKALVDAAIAERKERAAGLQQRGGSEEVEQVEYAGERDKEGTGTGDASGELSLEVKGRSLEREEAESLLEALKEGAERAEEIPLTIENWDKLFGESTEIVTPLEKVTMGEHQFVKLSRLGRNGKLGMVKPTLERPDIVISESSSAGSGSETSRPSSHIYVKTFVDESGERIYHFTSVTVEIDGKEVSISNQEKRPNRIINLLQNGRLIWSNPEKFYKEAISASDTQKEDAVLPLDSQSATQSAFTDSLGLNSKTSSDKGNTLSGGKQGNGAESSLGERIASGKSKSGKSYEVVVASDERRDGVRKVKFETRGDNGKRVGVNGSLLLPVSFIESENRAFEVAQGSSNINIAGVIVDASGAVQVEMKDGSMIAVNDLPAEISEKLRIKVSGKHREERLSDAEVVGYEAHVGGLLEEYVNNGWRKKDIIKHLRSETESLKQVYLAAGYSAEEAESKAEQLIEGIIEKLTPKQVGEFTVYVENERGSLRSGVDKEGNVWETEMKNDYGFIPGVKSTDGDNIDVFLSSDTDEWNGRKVYVVDQFNPDGTFDEHKVMLGFNDRYEAFDAYLSNYETGWEKGRRLEVTGSNVEDFEKWTGSAKRKIKPFADYKNIRSEVSSLRSDHNPSADALGTEEMAKDSKAKLHADTDSDGKRNREVYDVAKGLVESSGIEVVEVSDAEASEMLGYKNTPVADQPNRVNEKLTSGSVLAAHSGGSSSNATDSRNLSTKIVNDTQSAKNKIKKFKNGDFEGNYSTIDRAISSLGTLLAMRNRGGSRYSILHTEGGETVAVRLSDHGANGNNFHKDNADKNLSIVIERRKYDTPNSEIEFTEAIIPEAIFLERPEEVVTAIVKGVEDVLSDKDFSLDPKLGTVEKRGLYNPRFSIRTYHGTGADFDRFDFSHIGEGEGFQAFGWGGYVTEVEGIGKTYAQNIASTPLLDGKPFDHSQSNREFPSRSIESILKKFGGDVDRAIEWCEIMQEKWESIPHEDSSLKPVFKEDAAWLRANRDRISMPPRHLYTVEIPDDNGSNYLDWDGHYDIEDLERIASRCEELGAGDLISGEMVEDDEGNVTGYTTGKDIYEVLSEICGLYDGTPGDKEASRKLSKAFVGIKYPANYRNGGRVDGAKNYVVFREKDMEISNHIRFLRDGENRAYGWTVGGKVYLNRDAMNPETPIHEYTHLWDEMVRQENPELWASGKELLKQTPLWQKVLDDPNYADIRDDEDAVASEVHSRLTGERGAEILEDMIEKSKKDGPLAVAEKVTLVERIKGWLRDMFRALKATLDKRSKRELDDLTEEAFVNMTLRDLAEGLNPNTEMHRGAQMRAVTEANPMLDDYHVGIRERNDVRSFDEILAEAEKGWEEYGEMMYPDMTIEMLREAKESGKITVFSSKPIQTGTFVTPSRMNAEEYAGGLGSKVYSKTVPVDEVAWIDESEGQYAAVDKAVDAATDVEFTEEESEGTASELSVDYSAENANFANRYETADGKTINYTSENPEGYGGLFDFDFSEENRRVEAVDNRAGANRVQRQGDSGLYQRNSGLNEAAGEFSVVERVFTESGTFNFTSGEKIESAADVAFIFSALEDAAKEHSFVVLVKDGKPTVVELGMGTFTATMVDLPTASLAYSRIRPDQVYFVHNHPSGNLKCSPQDVQMLRKIEDMSDVPVMGVIINLKTGKYGTFDTDNNSDTGKKRTPEKENALTVHTLDKQIFAPDYDPMAQPLVRGSEDVAKFLNTHRMGDRAKMSFIILSRAGRIVGNIHTPYTEIPADVDDIARYISERVIQFGGESAILYGDFNTAIEKRLVYRKLKERMMQVGATTLLDVVQVKGNHTTSANDEGLLYEPGSEYGASPVGDIRFREVEDDAVLSEFTEGKTVKAYRTMQVIDGKLYSPMATKVGGKATPEIKLGVPEQAEEHPEIIKRTKIGKDGVEVGYVVIDKGLGKGTLEVAYNPSIHASRTALNDQFTSAHIRPNLVTVEVEIPLSELTSGYRANMAKDAVGEISWHSGSVSGQLAKLGNPRRVILSRYDRPVRIVPFREVAAMIAEQLDGTGMEIPYNVVQPQLRNELERLGVTIGETASGSVGEEEDFGKAEYITDQEIERINAHQQEMAQTSTEAKSSHAVRMSKKFNTPIRIVNDLTELKSTNAELQARMRRSKGFNDTATGEVVVVVPNNATVEDMAETVFHEVVAHRGLREMIGEENYDAFCDEIYSHLKDDLKKQVDEEAARRFVNEPEKGYEHHRRVAVDEMFGRMAEKGFEDFTKAERGIWAKLRVKVLEAINKFLGSLKLPKWVKLGDNELRYMLWRSHERLRTKGDYVDMARDSAKREELGLTRNEAVRTRKPIETAADKIEKSFDAAVSGDLIGKPVEVGKLTQDGRAFLEKLSGIKMKEDVSFVLNPSDLVHMYRNHFGSNEKDTGSNIPLTKEDIRAIADVISNPERIIFGIESDGLKRKLFYFLSPAQEGAYNLLEVYGDRKGNLTAKTFYKTKKAVSQRVLSLKKSEHLTSVTDGASLSDGAKLPKFFENPTIVEEESFEYRFRDGETGDIWKDQSVGLEERITNAAIRLSNNQSGDLTLRNDAMQAIGGNLTSLRKAMAAQKRYDQATVKRVADLARILMQNGYLSGMTSGEMQRMISAVKNSVGHKEIKESVQKIMDIMVNNQLRNGEGTLRQLLAIRGSKVDARGVEVQGMLDVEGQRTMEVVKKAMSLPAETYDSKGNLQEGCIAYLIDENLSRMSDPNKTIAEDAAIKNVGLNMAFDYALNIANSKADEKALHDSLKTAKEDKDAGRMTNDAYKQFVETTEDAIRKNKIERAEAYFNLVGRLSDSLRGSIENAKAFREAEKARVNEIHHNANSDMEGRPTNEHHKDDWKDNFMNNGLVQFLFAPLGTFDQIMRVFGNKSANGEGYLWNRFMRGWVDCRNKELQGVKEKFAQLDDKAAELFGKGKTWGDLIRLESKFPKASVSFWDGGEMRDHELTQGNLLYIYMVDKMTDGRMKLRRMGITEDDITEIENVLDPRFKALGDWLQEEFLVETWNEYNETHKRMFGASMAAIENYFPLKILANARVDKEEDVNQQNVPEGITTKTGSIIKRRVNNLALDITGSDALSVILDYIIQMEHWSAYAEWNRDLNTLRTYKRFRNQVINMTTVYGGGRKLWENFNDLCLMAAGEYRPPISRLNKNAVNLAKGVTAAKVSFRMYTALKQLLSAPAYAPEVSIRAIAKSIANPYGDFKWCLENMPIFRERWHSRISGDPRLLKSDMDWKMWRNRVMEISSRIGMTPNAFVDAVTVSIGARAMYETRLKQYLKEGYPTDAAEKRAMQDATILFNQTQQSSESPFLSTLQVDKDWLSTLFTVFRNSAMSYTRQEYDAMRNLKRNLTPGQRAKSIEFMTKMILRDWNVDPETATDAERVKAEDAAKNRFRKQIKKDIIRLATFGFILPLAWNLGSYLPYIIFGNNDDEKDKMWKDALTHSYFGSIEGLTGGDVMSSFFNMVASREWNWNQLSKEMPLASDINSIATKFIGGKNAEAINDILNLMVQMGTGMNPQSLTDAAIAITDACGDDLALSHEAALFVMRVLQVPQSQLDKLYFDEIDMSGEEASKLTPEQLAARYAAYKVKRGTPFAPWSWGDEERHDKYKESATDKMKERLDAQGDAKVIEAYADFEARYKEVSEKAKRAKELTQTDYATAAQAHAELRQDPDFPIYQRFGSLDKQLGRISKMWLTAKSPEEARLIAETIPAYRAGMVKVLQAETAESQQSAMAELTILMNGFYAKYQAIQLQPIQVNR